MRGQCGAANHHDQRGDDKRCSPQRAEARPDDFCVRPTFISPSAARTGNAKAELALELFAYRACKYVGAFAVVLEGLHGLVFTGGIGEHSASMRARICRRLAFLGIQLDERRNAAAIGSAALPIGYDGSAVSVWVIPTDEEGEIAQFTSDRLRVNA